MPCSPGDSPFDLNLDFRMRPSPKKVAKAMRFAVRPIDQERDRHAALRRRADRSVGTGAGSQDEWGNRNESADVH
jgi:hypothetical protein